MCYPIATHCMPQCPCSDYRKSCVHLYNSCEPSGRVQIKLYGIFPSRTMQELNHNIFPGIIFVGNKTDRSIMAARKQTGNSSSLVPLFDKDTEGVVYFVLFIGDTHSGHGIIGSMMDAHPNMVIAHEYM